MRARAGSLLAITLAIVLLWAHQAGAAGEMRLRGRVDVLPAGPGGTLTVPLAQGAPPVTVLVGLGTPAFQLPVLLTSSTFVEGGPLVLVDGEAVEVEARLEGGVLRATDIHREDLGEVRLRGTAQGLPGSGVLPLPPGLVVDFVIALGVPGGDLPVRLTSQAHLSRGPFTLANGVPIEIEGVVDSFRVLVTEIEPAVGDGGGTGGGGTGGGGTGGTAVGIRVRCRVPDGRVRIQIDGQGLSPGVYTASVTNTTTGAGPVVSKPQTATPTVFDLDFDFDSTAGAGDLDTPIAAGFASPGQVVQAVIDPGALATGQATCSED
jgi:hypothetical protein